MKDNAFKTGFWLALGWHTGKFVFVLASKVSDKVWSKIDKLL